MKKQEQHIKKAFIMMMLCLYVFGLIKPVLPLFKDVLAHTFFKTSHMATVHYENGRYHLHVELMDEAQKNESKQSTILSNDDALFSHLKNDEFSFTFYTQDVSEINSPYINVSTDVTIPLPLLPPEC